MDQGSKNSGYARAAKPGNTGNISLNCVIGLRAPRARSTDARFSAIEAEKLLGIISQASRINSHYEFFRFLQGEVQYFIPHQVLICAWGDFLGPNPKHDVISAIPGVRTKRLGDCNIDSLLKGFYLRWLGQKRQPMLFDGVVPESHAYPSCRCALHSFLRGARSVLVHGIHDARDGTDSLYLAAHSDLIVNAGDIGKFNDVIDPMIAQIDVAFRRVSGLKPSGTSVPQDNGARVLSTREQEILAWVSEGRTNSEISTILGISTFTVKNHVQRIIKKLGAANRTEAAAKYRQMAVEIKRMRDRQVRRTAVSAEAGFAAK